EDLVEGAADLENVLERLDAEYSAGRRVRERDGADVLDAIDAWPRPHVAAEVLLARKQAAEVGVINLSLDLVRPELEDRAGTVKGLGHEPAEGLVVVAHRIGRRPSLSWALESSLATAGSGRPCFRSPDQRVGS